MIFFKKESINPTRRNVDLQLNFIEKIKIVKRRFD